MAQEKKDGERRPVEADGNKGVKGFNKKGQEVPVPNIIADAVKYFPCTIDGEIIGEKLYAFDLLSFEGENLRGRSCEDRFRMLNQLHFGKAVEVVKTAYTKADKQKMYDDLVKNNAEGIVFKLKSSPYTAGRPASGGSHLKYKFYKTATFIVSNITKGKRSVGIALVEMEKDKPQRQMGKVTIPPNHEVPKTGELVEVRYLYCYRGGAVYQPTYLGRRTDSDLSDATTDQIIYKAEVETFGE